MNKELPLLSSLFSNADLTKFSKKFGEGIETDITKISKVDRRKHSSTNLTEISKKKADGYHDSNFNRDNGMSEQHKVVEHEDLECSNASSMHPDKQEMAIKHKKNSNSVPEKGNQRRERDSNPRDLAVTSFM